MTDIVERLRFEAKWARGEDGGIPEFVKLTVEEAADEIERLRAQVAKYDEERTQISPQGAARAADGGDAE